MHKATINRLGLLGLALLAYIAFLIISIQFTSATGQRMAGQFRGKVVLSAPIQVLMYAGDRFLAANVETIRVAAIGPMEESAFANYRIRAHLLVSSLNACNEDNYYLANAMLSWGGWDRDCHEVLDPATRCRFWDEFPPFFLGFNQYFFDRDIDSAVKAIKTAASRSDTNRATLQRIAIVMESKKLNDEKMAAAYLREQRDQTTDQKLKQSLDRRLKRLQGLITLRDAQAEYEKRFNQPLTDPQQLVERGILESFPQDPMRLGYEFKQGEFRFKQIKLPGMERPK